MNVDRMIRVNELLRREIGEALFHVIHESGFDLSAVTVTHVVTARNLRHARVLISVRGHEGKREDMLALVETHRPAIQARINRNLILKYTPRLSFELDTSIEKGDHVLSLLAKLERESEDDSAQGSRQEDPSVL